MSDFEGLARERSTMGLSTSRCPVNTSQGNVRAARDGENDIESSAFKQTTSKTKVVDCKLLKDSATTHK